VLSNQTPVAYEDYPVTAEDTEIVVKVTGNDTDADDDPLAVIEIAQPFHGTAFISGTGQVAYTPTLYDYGGDSLDYTVSLGLRRP